MKSKEDRNNTVRIIGKKVYTKKVQKVKTEFTNALVEKEGKFYVVENLKSSDADGHTEYAWDAEQEFASLNEARDAWRKSVNDLMETLHPKAKQHRFYGMLEDASNKRFRFNGATHKNVITIVTTNVRRHKDGFVLLIGNNELIYLKDWQLSAIYCHEMRLSAFAVHLNRDFFKPYIWQSGTFEDVSFDKPDTFDSLLDTAIEQAYELKCKPGHYGYKIQCDFLKWS